MKKILICSIAVLSLSASAFAGGKKYMIVLHQQNQIPASVEKAIQNAGGTITTRIPQIGALGAVSDNPNFAAEVDAISAVDEVSEDVMYRMIPPTDKMKLQAAGDGPVEPPGDDTQTGTEPFYNPYQWDKKRIRASNQGSYAVQQGRPDVVVAVLDTGAQVLPVPHPDIAPNLDAARSRSFVVTGTVPGPATGDPNPAAWDDKHGHGSHCLSNVGAPINAIGMSGVAPKITLVALKVLDDNGDGSFLWTAQALVYAAINKFDVASMSLGGYVPHNQGGQTIIKIVQRAVNFAREHGVTPVAALSNESYDISDGRTMGPFMVVPAEIDGVIGISATGYTNLKASYSNYGVGKTDVSAPGGDYYVGVPTNAPHAGMIVGAWASDSTTLPGANYALSSGTSMACPNAAGVVALIISQYGDFSTTGNGRKTHMPPQKVEAILQQTANNQPCPDAPVTYYYDSPPAPPNTPVEDVFPEQRCDGGDGYNNFYGKGIVDALKAVTNTQ